MGQMQPGLMYTLEDKSISVQIEFFKLAFKYFMVAIYVLVH